MVHLFRKGTPSGTLLTSKNPNVYRPWYSGTPIYPHAPGCPWACFLLLCPINNQKSEISTPPTPKGQICCRKLPKIAESCRKLPKIAELCCRPRRRPLVTTTCLASISYLLTA